jgi:stage V sporulation protein B
VPISIVAIIVPAIYFIDSSIVVPLIQGQLAGGAREAQEILGILVGRAQSFAGIPPILAIALSTSIIPIISAAYARNDQKQLQTQASLAMRLALLAGLPIVLMLVVAARSYNMFLFGDAKGTWIIIFLTSSAIFQVLMMTSGSILMGLGMPRRPMMHVGIGIALKLLLSFVLAPSFGVYGIILATALAFFAILILNIRVLRKQMVFEILGVRWSGLIITALVMLAIGIVMEQLLFAWHWQAWLIALFSSLVLSVLYPILLAVTGVLRQTDVDQFPQKLRKILIRFHFNKFLRG